MCAVKRRCQPCFIEEAPFKPVKQFKLFRKFQGRLPFISPPPTPFAALPFPHQRPGLQASLRALASSLRRLRSLRGEAAVGSLEGLHGGPQLGSLGGESSDGVGVLRRRAESQTAVMLLEV